MSLGKGRFFLSLVPSDNAAEFDVWAVVLIAHLGVEEEHIQILKVFLSRKVGLEQVSESLVQPWIYRGET